MAKTLIKSRIHSNKHKTKIKQEINNTKSFLPPNLQSFIQKLLLGNDFIVYKSAWKFCQLLDNEPLDNSIIKKIF